MRVKFSKKINKKKLICLLCDVLSLVAIVGIIFNLGRRFQIKRDSDTVKEYKEKYQQLYGDFQYYRAHSYILYGEEWYQDQGLLPK